MHKLFRMRSNINTKPKEIVNPKPSFPQHNQISQTIFLCVNKHFPTRDNQSHSNREIIDISDDDDEDENTCKNGTSIEDSSDEEEIEVIQLSDDDEDEVNDESSILILEKHNKINQFHNDFDESLLDLTHKNVEQQRQSTDLDFDPSNLSTSHTVHHQPLFCPVEEDNNPNGTVSRNHVLLTLGLTCSECSVLIDSRLKLEQHLLDEHGKLPFKCMIRGCNLQFMERSQLDKHYLNHQFHIAYINPNTKWTCSVANCRSAVSVKTSFMTHVHLYHEAGLFQCAICLEQFSRRFLVYNHYKAKHRYTQERGCIGFRCIWPNCGGGGRIFNYFSNAIAHIRTVHLNVPVFQEDAFHKVVKSYRVPSEFVQKIQIINHAQESRIYHREIV